jgi:hypothetical protein
LKFGKHENANGLTGLQKKADELVLNQSRKKRKEETAEK